MKWNEIDFEVLEAKSNDMDMKLFTHNFEYMSEST